MKLIVPFIARKRTLVPLIVVLGAVLCAALYMYESERSFMRSYATYRERAEDHAQLAFLPGSVSNGNRQELNQILAEVLARPMSPAERATKAQRGLQLLREADIQVDTIGTRANAVAAAIAEMEASARSLGALRGRSKRLEIVDAARKAELVIEDIRGLSYRSNFHTAEVFTRILTDRGELTPAYIQELNNQIPQLEEQFNKRTNLYVELEGLKGRIGKVYADIEA